MAGDDSPPRVAPRLLAGRPRTTVRIRRRAFAGTPRRLSPNRVAARRVPVRTPTDPSRHPRFSVRSRLSACRAATVSPPWPRYPPTPNCTAAATSASSPAPRRPRNWSSAPPRCATRRWRSPDEMFAVGRGACRLRAGHRTRPAPDHRRRDAARAQRRRRAHAAGGAGHHAAGVRQPVAMDHARASARRQGVLRSPHQRPGRSCPPRCRIWRSLPDCLVLLLPTAAGPGADGSARTRRLGRRGRRDRARFRQRRAAIGSREHDGRRGAGRCTLVRHERDRRRAEPVRRRRSRRIRLARVVRAGARRARPVTAPAAMARSSRRPRPSWLRRSPGQGARPGRCRRRGRPLCCRSNRCSRRLNGSGRGSGEDRVWSRCRC